MCQKYVVKVYMLIYYCWVKEKKGFMFLSKISILLCMITQYIDEENIFVVIPFMLLEQQKH